MHRSAAPTTAQSTARAEWLAARALLASRRLRPLLPAAVVGCLVLLATIWLLRGPLARDTHPDTARSAPTTGDTASLVEALGKARRDLVRAESLFAADVAEAVRKESAPGGPALAVRRPMPAPARRERDSLLKVLTELDSALDRAAKAPLGDSYRVLATTVALRPLGVVSVLLDTLRLLDEVRRTLDPAAAPQREFAQLSERTNAIGVSLQEIGQSRRSALRQRLAQLDGDTADSAVAMPDTARSREARNRAQSAVANAEAEVALARRPRPAGRAAASPSVVVRILRIGDSITLPAAIGAMLLAAVLVFTAAVAMEARYPTIAHAREAERVSGVPVLATLRSFRIPRERSARLLSDASRNPFHLAYVTLSLGESRATSLCVTGDHPALVVAAAGQLAASAAADACATLVVDLATGTATVAKYFGWSDEPGFTDAIAGVRLWREVARPIGATEGVDIDLIPGGAPRTDTAEAVAMEANRREFALFRSQYDFTVFAAPSRAALDLAALTADKPQTVVLVRTARTRIAELHRSVAALHDRGIQAAGLIVFDR
jgi:hypothetical protein